MSQFAFAPLPEQQASAPPKAKMPSLDQVDRNLIAENKALQEEKQALQEENHRLRTSNLELEARIGSTRKVTFVLVAAMVVMLVVSFTMFQSLQAFTQQLSSQVSSLEGQIAALSSMPPATSSSGAAVKPKLPAKTKATATPKPVSTVMVYIPHSGHRYHDSKACAGSAPTLVSLEEAKKRGYTPCGNCDPPR
ncbi:MAG: hypothetical protein E7319_02320 [Clostridiales bacterium]|nr:hypothetical protein [Clostridiales bacterium]